jgi:4-amino-4-deoxy-L-arabinose transferase-like glycosyltransferase
VTEGDRRRLLSGPAILGRDIVIGVALLAALPRVLRLVEARGEPEWDRFLLDSAYYHDMARTLLARGGTFDRAFDMAPLYGYALAAVHVVFGAADPLPVYLLQVGLGVASAVMAAALGQRLGGRIAAAVAGAVVALDPVSVVYDVRLLSVSLATFLSTGAALLAWRAWSEAGAGADAGAPSPRRNAFDGLPVVRRPGLRAAIGAGLLLGLAATARGNLLLSLPWVLLCFTGRGRRRAGIALALAAAFPLGATVAHNLHVADEPAVVSVNGGINLYRGNNPWVIDTAVQPFRLPGEQDALARRARLVASVDQGEWLTMGQVDRHWRARTLADWTDDPVRASALLLRKSHQALALEEIGDNVDTKAVIARSRWLGWMVPLHGVAVAFGLAGLLLRPRSRDDLPLLALLVSGVGSVALFFVVDRYRAPLLPLWAAYAGAAAAAAWQARRRLGHLGVVVAALLVLSRPTLDPLLPWNSLAHDRLAPACLLDEHVRRDPDLERAYEAGVAAMRAGDLTTARRRFADVFLADPVFTAAGVNLGHLLLRAGEHAEAASVSERVVREDPCDDKAWFNLAAARSALRRHADALLAVERAVALDRYEPRYRFARAASRLALGQTVQAHADLRWVVRWDPQNDAARAALDALGGPGLDGSPTVRRPEAFSAP